MIKVTDNSKIGGVDKKKKSKNADAAKGADFAGMVEKASDVDAPEETGSFSAGGGLGSSVYQPLDQDIPQDAAGRGSYMLETLEELEKDILSGSPTQALEKLKKALDTQAIDRDQLNSRMQKLMDEIELRASVEVAKLEEGK